jgi:hypothetical protein
MPDNEAVEAFDHTWDLAIRLPRWRLRLWRWWLRQRTALFCRDVDLIALAALNYTLNHYRDVHVNR